MNTTLSWIKAYVPDLTCTAQEYTDAMTLSGTKVEGYEAADRDLDKIVIGQIEKIEKHPDSDHLIICQVNVGAETIQIVTGAPNVKEGDKIPVVLDGGRVAGNHDGKMTEGGIQIKKGKLRGVESNGMMCSIEELGSSREFYPEAPEYGIYIFPEDAVVGADAIEELGLHDVTFEYEKDIHILEDLNFQVKAGESIALVGPTGAGKTTVVNLISRFYNLTDGELLIDGEYDIAKVTLHSLRTQMGIMLQDSFIFSGTIMDNIRYGRLDATPEEVEAAAKAVRAHDFIMEMEKGYYTEVNERGSRLSQGQKQLIAFARTLLSDPKILILDEATSSIDTKTERLLQEGIAALLKGRTSFIIAHRLSTIKNCDRILYIGNKQVLESGSHEELLAKKGLYYHLYTAQAQDQGVIATV